MSPAPTCLQSLGVPRRVERWLLILWIIAGLATTAGIMVYVCTHPQVDPVGISEYDWMLAHPPNFQPRKVVEFAFQRNPEEAERLKKVDHSLFTSNSERLMLANLLKLKPGEKEVHLVLTDEDIPEWQRPKAKPPESH